MNYGHPSNTGHGRRLPSYEWTPSFSPVRHRRTKKPGRSRNVGKSCGKRNFNRFPRETYTKQSLVPNSFIEGVAEVLTGAVGAFLWLHWDIFLAAGLIAILLRYISRQARKVEKKCIVGCEKTYSAYRINRKTSVNQPPTAEAVLAAWETTRGPRRGDPDGLAARLRLGAMLSDLETTVDQSYIRDEDGTIVGRNPGLKGWIAANCAALLPHYKSLMAYKALSDKLRVALCIEEPDTLDGAMEIGCIDSFINCNGKKDEIRNKTSVNNASEDGEKQGEGEKPLGKNEGKVPRSLALRRQCRLLVSREESVRKAHREMFGSPCPATMAALEAAVRSRLGLVWMRRGKRRPLAA